jgi:2-keto-3-deoxy-L-fuconate dehydrogenase
MTGRLEGKTALVTAAGQGIGRATAQAMASEGATVIAVDRDIEKLTGLDTCQAHALDVTDRRALAALADETGAIDILFNGVGWVHSGTLLDCDEDAWAATLETNVTSMYRVTRAFLPAMIEAGGGAIINMSSVASSITGVPGRFAYGTSKAAVIGLTKAVAADFVARGIRCNAICPGTVDSPSLRERVAAMGDAKAAMEKMVSRQPMGRLGLPDEVAALAVYLASDESAFTTGAIHVIDGGWTT